MTEGRGILLIASRSTGGVTEPPRDLFVRTDRDGFKVVLIIPKPPHPAHISIQGINDAMAMTYVETVIDVLEDAGLVRRVGTSDEQ